MLRFRPLVGTHMWALTNSLELLKAIIPLVKAGKRSAFPKL